MRKGKSLKHKKNRSGRDLWRSSSHPLPPAGLYLLSMQQTLIESGSLVIVFITLLRYMGPIMQHLLMQQFITQAYAVQSQGRTLF